MGTYFMKVLQLTKHLNVGGITSQVFTLAKGLQARSHEVIILSGGGSEEKQFKDAEIRCLTYALPLKAILHPDCFKAIRFLKELVRTEKIDVIHAHTRVWQFVASFVSKSTRVPLVTTAHGIYQYNLGRKLFPARGHKTIAISDHVKHDLMVTHGCLDENVITVWNGIDTQALDSAYQKAYQKREEIKKEHGLKTNSFVVGMTSRMVEVKGHAVTISAMHDLISNQSPVEAVLVGDGPLKNELQSQVKRLGLEKSIHFIPPTPDIAQFYAIMDVLVTPVLYEEGFGMVVPEAMSLGVPVIASKRGAFVDLIINGQDGLLVESDDYIDLALGIKTLMKNEKLRKTMVKNARQKAADRYSMERMAEQTEKVYFSVVKS